MARPAAPARLPLFERLAPDGHGRPLDEAGLRAAVGRELSRLLNQRRAGAAAVPLGVIDYGIPDWTGLSAASHDDRQQLARSIVQAVQVFVSPLLEPRAEVAPHPADGQRVLVALSGRLRVGGALVPAAWRIGLASNGTTVMAVD